MLGYRYLKINGTAIPNPVPGTFQIEFTPDETIENSEAGTELGAVKRLDKKTFKADFQVTSFWRQFLENVCKVRTVTLNYQGTDYTVRARGYNPKLFENSEWTEGTEGLWTINLTFTEL